MTNKKTGIWDSAMSTTTMLYIRQTASGVWRTAFVLLAMLVLWGVLQRGVAEQHLDITLRWKLEHYRTWTGPLCLLPVLISAFFPAKKLMKSPSLPGRGILITLLLTALVLLGGLIPYMTWQNQIKDEQRCREVFLPMVYELWKKDGADSLVRKISCPCQQWEMGLGNYNIIEGKEVIAADLYPWHPHGRLGITVEGKVVFLDY